MYYGFIKNEIYLYIHETKANEFYSFRPSFFYFLIYEKIFKMLESGGRNKNKNKNSKIEESKKKKKKKKKKRSLITFFFF